MNEKRFSEETYLSIVDYIRKADIVRDPEGVVVDYKGNKMTRKEYWNKIDFYKQYFRELGFSYGSEVPISVCTLNVPEFELIFLAAIDLGLVVSSNAISFLASDIIKHTTEKKAHTLILNIEYCYEPQHAHFEMKEAFKILHEQKGDDRLKRIIFLSASDYLPEDKEKAYKDNLDYDAIIKELELPEDIEIIYPGTIKKYSETATLLPANDETTSLLDKDAVYSNTGGTTTGVPSCAVHKHQNMLNLLHLHEPAVFPGFPVKEGDRELLLIPVSHIAAQFLGILIRRSIGACLVYNPVAYDAPEELIRCIISDNINSFFGTITVYNMLVRYPGLTKGCLSHLRVPSCGGEVLPPGPTAFINERLQWAGSVPMFAVGGSTGMGGGMLNQFGMAQKNRCNQTGFALPGTIVKIINPKNGEECAPGEDGLLYVHTPTSLNRFLNNPEGTNKFYSYTDKEGRVYGTDHDIGQIVGIKQDDDILGDMQDPNVYQLNSRPQDVVRYDQETGKYHPAMIFDDSGELHAFDLSECSKLYVLRNKLLDLDEIAAVEVVIIPYSKTDKFGTLVCDVVLQEGVKEVDALKNIYASFEPGDTFIPEGILFLVDFQRSPSTDKRETATLRNVREGYYRVDSEGNIQQGILPENSDFIWNSVDSVEKVTAPLPVSIREIREQHRDAREKVFYHQS